MKADQNDIENLATLLVAAGCNYIMGVPEGDDCMLMYQCTGYHEAAGPARRSLACAPSTSSTCGWRRWASLRMAS